MHVCSLSHVLARKKTIQLRNIPGEPFAPVNLQVKHRNQRQWIRRVARQLHLHRGRFKEGNALNLEDARAKAGIEKGGGGGRGETVRVWLMSGDWTVFCGGRVDFETLFWCLFSSPESGAISTHGLESDDLLSVIKPCPQKRSRQPGFVAVFVSDSGGASLLAVEQFPGWSRSPIIW